MAKDVLYDWQRVIHDIIQQHDDLAGSEAMQDLDNYNRNRESSVRIHLPARSGHTTLASFLATMYPCVLVYSTIDHYKMLKHYANDFIKLPDVRRDIVDDEIVDDDFHPNTVCISVYQLYHDLMSQSKTSHPVSHMVKLSKVFQSEDKNFNRIAVVDNATKIFESHPEIMDYIYHISSGAVVALG